MLRTPSFAEPVPTERGADLAARVLAMLNSIYSPVTAEALARQGDSFAWGRFAVYVGPGALGSVLLADESGTVRETVYLRCDFPGLSRPAFRAAVTAALAREGFVAFPALAATCAPLSARVGRRADVLIPMSPGAGRIALAIAHGVTDFLAAVTAESVNPNRAAAPRSN